MNVVPQSREASELWGRIKVIRDDWQQHKALSLSQVMNYPFDAYLKSEPYAWSWSTAVFFDHDPELRIPFRELKNVVDDTGSTFATRLWNKVKSPRQVQEQWQWYLGNLDYGYDIEREIILRRDVQSFPAQGGSIAVLAERGWQSSGWRLEVGKTYSIEAKGRFQIALANKPWPCEANGVTLRYHQGEPLGKLLAAITDEGNTEGTTPLLTPRAIGNHGEISCERAGVLYFRLNDAPSERFDNSGEVRVSVQIKSNE
jgi:hypothetical protein